MVGLAAIGSSEVAQQSMMEPGSHTLVAPAGAGNLFIYMHAPTHNPRKELLEVASCHTHRM